MTNKVIEIKQLNKEYKMFDSKKDKMLETVFFRKEKHKTFKALENIDLEINEGEVLGILGKNGAGKSTLLKIITGVVTATSGDIMVKGKISSLLELGAAFNLDLTGIENIYQHGQVMGLTNEEIKVREKDIIDFADIGDHLYQPVKTYSSGMFARLAFACAINVDPDILIVDEVLSVGDIAFQLKCFKRFEEFKKKGKTIIFVSHNISDILANCTRTIVLENGTKIFDGSTKDGVDFYKKRMAESVEKKSTKINKTSSNNKNNKKEKLYQKEIELNPNMDRYGNKKIEIVDFCIFNEENKISNIIDNNEEVTVYIKLRSDIDAENVMVTFSIKDFNGIEYCGISEYIDFKSGQIVEISYKQKIPLKPERYTLSLGCGKIQKNGEVEIFDRMYDCILFQITSDEGLLGLFKLNSKIEKNIINK